MRKSSRRLFAGTGAAILLGVLCVFPFVVRGHYREALIFLFINTILVSSFRFLALTGEFSFSHVVLMGVGAYASALVTQLGGLSPWLGLPIGVIAAAGTAYLLSFPLFRMKGFYFVIGSFAAGEVIRQCWVAFRVPFGGADGLMLIPTLAIGSLDLGQPLAFYFFALAVMLLSLVILYRVEKSYYGFVLKAIYSQDLLVGSVGVDRRRHRVQAFVIASAFAGLAGALLAHYLTAVNPRDFGLTVMLSVLVWAIAGGLSTFGGPIVGVVALSILDLWLRAFEEYRPFFYGAVLILTMLFLPEGLQGLPSRLMAALAALRRQRAEPERTAVSLGIDSAIEASSAMIPLDEETPARRR